ncbi:MAG: hypothetical protein WC716_11630 [Chitinophagaceae bacterium]
MRQENNNPKSSFAGNSLYLFAAKFFPALAIFITTLFFSHKLDAEEYGQYQNFWIQLFFLSAIATIGFPVFALTYSGTKLIAIIRRITTNQLLLFSGFSLLLSVIFGSFQYYSNNTNPIICAAFFMLFACVVISDSFLIVFKSYRKLISVNIVYSLLFIGLHYWKISNDIPFTDFLKTLIILLFLRLVVNTVLIKRHASGVHNLIEEIAESEWLRIKKLWIQLGLNDVTQVLFRWIDKFILSFILAKELFGVYTNATIEIAFLPLIFSAVSSAAVQHWAHYQSTKTLQNQISILHYSSRILSSIVFPLFFFLLFFREEFLITVFSEKYISGVWIFVCAQLVLPVRAYPFTALLQSHHRGDIINKGSVIDFILACILMYPLYLLLGLPGVALSFVISTYWQAGYYLVHASRLLNTPIGNLLPVRILLRKFLLFAAITGLSYFAFTQIFSSTTGIFWAGMISLFSVGGISLLYEWNKNTKQDEHAA